MPQRVCDVWTASWVDCTCLGEPITRDSQDERDQNYAYCLCQEHRGNIADVTSKWHNETCAACMPMNDGTPNHLLSLSGMHLQHMNIRPGCNVTVVIVVMTNCTHLPNLFARVGVLAVEHIAVGSGDSLVCKQMPWKAESF